MTWVVAALAAALVAFALVARAKHRLTWTDQRKRPGYFVDVGARAAERARSRFS